MVATGSAIKLKNFLDSLPVGTSIIGLHGTIVTWDRDCVRIFQVNEREALGQYLISFFPKTQHTKIQKLLLLPPNYKKVRTEIFERIDKKGERQFIEINVSRLNKGLSQSGFVAVFKDVTQKVMLEDVRNELMKSNEKLLQKYDEKSTHLNAILSNVPGVVWEAFGRPDRKGQHMNFVSDYVEKMTGYTVGEWLGVKNFWLKIVHPDDKRRAAREAAAIFSSREKRGVSEFRWVRKDGRVIWVEAQSSVIVDGNGDPIGMRGVTLDITKRKMADVKMRNKEQLEKALMRIELAALKEKGVREFLQEAVEIVTDTMGMDFGKIFKLSFESNAFLLEVGTGWKKEAIGKYTINLDIRAQSQYTLKIGKPVVVEDLRIEQRFDASTLLRDYNIISGVTVIIPGKRKPYGVLGVHSKAKYNFSNDDISFLQAAANIMGIVIEKKNNSEALRKSEERYKSLVLLAPDVIYAIDLAGNLTDLNPSFERITGWKTEEWIGKSFLGIIHPDDAKFAFKMFKKVLRGHEESFELRVRSKDGNYLVGEFVCTPRYEAGKLIGVFGIARDITTRKYFEKQQEFLVKASKLLSSTLNYEKTIRNIAKLMVPEISDWFAVDLVEKNLIKNVVVHHRDRNKVKLAKRYFSLSKREKNHKTGVATVISTGIPQLVSDVPDEMIRSSAQTTEEYELLKQIGFSSIIVVPMKIKELSFGVITLVNSESGRKFTEEDLKFVEDLAQRISLAIENSRLYQMEKEARQTAQENSQRITQLQNLTAALSEAVTLSEVAKVIIGKGIEILGASAGSVGIVNSDKKEVVVIDSTGYSRKVLKKWIAIPFSARTPLTDVVQKKKAIFIPNIKQLTLQYPNLVSDRNPQNKSAVALPLLVKGKVIGSIGLSFEEEKLFGSDDKMQMESISRLCAQALERAQLYEREKKARANAEEEIHQRKAIESALRYSEERFRSIVELAPDVIYSLSPKGIFTEINPAFERVTGWKVKDWIGRSYKELVHPEDLEIADEEFKNGIHGKPSQPYELRIPTKSGRYIVAEFRSIPRVVDGKIAGKLGIFRDITDRKHEERQRDYMLGIASHELKTPLASIKVFTQVMMRQLNKEGNDKYIDYITKIDQQINKLNKLIGGLLDITRVRAGRLTLNEEIFLFDELVAQVVSDIQAMSPHHKIILKSGSQTYIKADKERIERVLINLITNAVKYSPYSDKVVVKCLSKKDTVTVSVRDYGIGIPKENFSRIFEPFSGLNQTPNTTKIASVGLGLYISSELVKIHGGKIWVESTEGKGSTFYVSLPINGEVSPIKSDSAKKGVFA